MEEKAKLYDQMTKGDFPGQYNTHTHTQTQHCCFFFQLYLTLRLTCHLKWQMKRRRDCIWSTSPRRSLTNREKHIPQENQIMRIEAAPLLCHPLKTLMKNGIICLLLDFSVRMYYFDIYVLSSVVLVPNCFYSGWIMWILWADLDGA